MTDDKVLRQAFDTLRRHDELRVPSFDGIVRRRAIPIRHRRIIRVAVSALTVLLAIAALEVWHPYGPRNQRSSAQFILAWRAPTDFLLHTPGSELMSDVPQIENAVPDPIRQPLL